MWLPGRGDDPEASILAALDSAASAEELGGKQAHMRAY